MSEVLPDSDPADLPVDQLEVVPLGEDGDAYIVVGTANPITAETALAAYMLADGGAIDAGEAADWIQPLLPNARVDWYWQDASDAEAGEHDVERWLRALAPSLDGRQWGNDGTMRDHADEPLFRGVYFG